MSETSKAPAWWTQGNLHDKTMADWFASETDNQMATCLDIIMAMKEDMNAHIHYTTGEELMRYVVELMSCMTAAAIEQPQQDKIQVANLALSSAEVLGYLPTTAPSTTY